jgi:hypothetical protein
MSVGVYGTKKLADVSFLDVDILYSYSPTREEIGDVTFKPLFSNVTDAEFKSMIGADGMYKLRLPADKFNNLGFYSVLIKPKAFEITISDCSNIVTTDNNQINISKKGIIIPSSQISSSLLGYQVEYFDTNGQKIRNLHRIVTSHDKVSISSNSVPSVPGTTGYVLDPNGSFVFLTLTPDEGSLVSGTGGQVDIGRKGQRIILSNTFFDPVYIEVEMVEHTINTLSYALYGNSTRDLETGVLTYFDSNNRIYRQYNLFTRKKNFGNGNIDVREQRTILNLSQNFDNISQGLNQ